MGAGPFRSQVQIHLAVLAGFLLLGWLYTHPLLAWSGTHIAGDPPVDPLLNASVLWWNATNVPLTETWWNAPYYHPAQGVTAFTENLLGVSPIASPIYWVTGNPLTAYNVALYLTWPLSAFAAYLLAWFLTRRVDAAIIAGLAYGFSTYRTAELGHIQMMCSFWIPLALLGLHGYLLQRRVAWLALFGGGWLLQSLANLYLMLFGAVLIALWIAYFCTQRAILPASSRRVTAAILAVWLVASIPLVPILLTYRDVHDYYGLERSLSEPIGFSYPLQTWLATSGIVWLWSHMLPDDGKNHFPGLTVVVLAAAGVIARIASSPVQSGAPRRRRLVIALSTIMAISLAVILVTMLIGRWQVRVLGVIPLRLNDLDRAVTMAVVSGAGVMWLSRRLRTALQVRSPMVFYVFATVAMWVFAIGPVIPAQGQILLEPAPYRLLMALPGFDGLRVPARFWMLGVLCLAVAAGFAYRVLTPQPGRRRRLVFSLAAAGLLLDAWTTGLNMVAVDPRWPVLESTDQRHAILELPTGDGTADAMATFRSIGHRRPVYNGVSGYEPSHFTPLIEGIRARDPEMLRALTSLGPLDVVLEDSDPAGWAAYVTGHPGAARVATDGNRSTYRLPAAVFEEPELGDPIPIARISASVSRVHRPPSLAVDGDLSTPWHNGPQHPEQSFAVDLGHVHDVGGVTGSLGEWARDFPRRLAIDVSMDAKRWDTVWQGSTVGKAFLAAARAPREVPVRFAFAPRPARFVRLRQLATATNLWAIAELQVHRAR